MMDTRIDTQTITDLPLNEVIRSMYGHTNDPIALYDIEGEVLGLNDAFVELFRSLTSCSIPKNINEILAFLNDKEGVPSEVYRLNHYERPLMITVAGVPKKTVMRFGPLIIKDEVFGGFVMIIDITEAATSFDERDRRLRSLINDVGIGIVILNQEHRVIDTNTRFAEMIGYSVDEMYDLHIWDWDADMSEAEIRESFKDLSGLEASFETRHRRKDGSIYNVLISVYGALLEGTEKTYSASICVCQDITELKEMQKQLQLSEFKYRNLVENSSEIFLSMAEDSTIEYVSPNCESLTGYLPIEFQGKKITEFVNKERFEELRNTFSKLRNSSSPSSHDLSIRHKDELEHCYNISFSPSLDIDSKKIFVLHARNIDERKEYESKLEYLSTHDQLTGTYNRRFFDTYFDRQLKNKQYPFSILLCDVDNLKSINDTFGHAKGDEIIKLCVQAIQSTLRKGDFLARMGGDEFVAALPNTGEAEAMKIIERIEKALDTFDLEIDGAHYKLSVSIGCATALNENYSIEELLNIADAEMYAQKRKYFQR